MINKKKLILLLAGFGFIAVLGAYFIPGMIGYFKFKKAAEAASAMPWQDGGMITRVTPCILDTPANAPTTCAVSCPGVTIYWGTACAGYDEIDVAAQMGTLYMAAPKGFIYSGGGVYPKSGDQFIAGGAYNGLPWVIGIPGPSASRIQKLADAFKLIIAGVRRNF